MVNSVFISENPLIDQNSGSRIASNCAGFVVAVPKGDAGLVEKGW